jgi:hypothetical protein
MMHRARYTMRRIGDAVLLEDAAGETRSVTNDAEGVIRDLVERGVRVDKCVIVYRDTMGIWDQLLTHNGEFATFHPLGVRTGEEAAMKALRCKGERDT